MSAIILHELAHYAAACVVGFRPQNFVIRGFGIEMCSNEVGSGTGSFVFIAVCGPLINLILATCGYMLKNYNLFAVNIAVASINLLPAMPLDGGQIFYGAVCNIINRSAAKKICKYTGLAVGTTVSVLGLYILCESRFNFSLMYIGLFVIFTNLGTFYNPVTEVIASRNRDFGKSNIFVIDENMSALKAANAMPVNAIGAVRDSDGKIYDYVTPKYIYEGMTEMKADSTVKDIIKRRF